MRFLPVLLAVAAIGAQDAERYSGEIARWRAQREMRLKADDGWLTVAGLFWLKEGVNRAGSAAGNEIVLPPSSPAVIGRFEHTGGRTVFVAEHGVNATVNEKPVERIEMQPDTAGAPDIVTVGDLSMFVIQRGKRFAIRLRDRNSRFRTGFRGLEWFSVDPRYRLTARWVPYQPAKRVAVRNVLGETEMRTSPGYAVFTLDGKECRLDPVLENGRLFIIFRDQTAGKETYSAGRFLYADPPKEGTIVLDFNKAYNPPCAFNPYTTCPLPPPQNRLAVRIPAGEKAYRH